jgi:uncharacterized protein YraI
MAMVLATWADASVTPKTECAWAQAHGYKALGQGTYYGYFVPAAKRYNLTCYQLNSVSIYGNANSSHHATAKNAVDNGDLVIACMGRGTWTRSGHYVLLWGIEGNMVYINDPASSSLARTRGNYLVFKQQVKYYWVIKRPAGKPLSGPVSYANVDYAVKITDRAGLNCRKGPGTSYEVVKVYPYLSETRISQVSGTGWGKTDAGWINLTNTERVKDMTEAETKTLISSMLDERFETLKDQIGEVVKAAKPTVYNEEKDIPPWYLHAYETIKPVLKGTGKSLGLSEDTLKVVTLLGRLGKL